MIIENNIYEELRNYVKEHRGFSSELKETELYKRYVELMNKIKEMDGKRVKVDYKYQVDFSGCNGEKVGRIKVDDNKGVIRFYEGRNRKRFYYLDVGLFEGWFATLIVKKIELIKDGS